MSENESEIRLLLATLDELGARLEIDGDQILCHVVVGSGLPTSVQEAVRKNKPVLLRRLRRLAYVETMPALSFGDRCVQAPLSSVQQRIWFHECLHEESSFYSVPLAMRIRGPLDPALLRLAWQHVAARHPALECIVLATYPPMQRVQPGCVAPLNLADWEGRPEASDDSILTQALAARARPLKADGATLANADLYRLGSEDHVLLITLHHLIADGWSMSIVMEDLFAIYKKLAHAKVDELPPLVANYFDYVRWHEAYARSRAFEEDLAYWRRSLEGAARGFDPLPSYSSEPQAVDSDMTHRRERRVCDLRLHEAITAWSASSGGTVHSVMLSAWVALLHRWAACDDIVAATVVAGRPAAEFDRVVGCFINTLPVRIRIRPELDFHAHHTEVLDHLLAGYEHQHCPLESIVKAVNPTRGERSNPLFNTGLLLQNYPVPEAQGGDLEFALVPFERHGGSLDLCLIAGMAQEKFVMILEYSTAWLDAATARDLIKAYIGLLETVLTQPETSLIDLLAAVDWGELQVRRRVVVGANFIVEPMADAFEFWRGELELPYDLRFVPHEQIIQSLVEPASLMPRHSDYCCLFLRLEDWLIEADQVVPAALKTRADLFIDACLEYQRHSRATLIVWFCPVFRRSLQTLESEAALEDVQNRLRRRLAGVPRIHLRWPESYVRKYDFSDAENEEIARVGQLPYRQKAYTAFGTLLARELAGWARLPVKAVIFADNILWRGVCSEDGIGGVKFDDAALDLQRFFLAMRSQGVALCLCSKAAEADIHQVFGVHSESALRWTDFSIRRINSLSKSQNVREIAAELNIGLGSVVFIDDNPVECGEVEAHCPELLCLLLPALRGEIAAFLHSVWELDLVQSVPNEPLRTGAKPSQDFAASSFGSPAPVDW